MRGSDNPSFDRFSEGNWNVVAELEAVAKELGRSMAQVALNGAVNRAGIASAIVGATRLGQLQDNLGALAFDLPEPLWLRPESVSQTRAGFPYTYFAPPIQSMIAGAHALALKPPGRLPPQRIAASNVGATAAGKPRQPAGRRPAPVE